MSGKSGNRSLFHPMKSPNLFVMPKSPTVGWKWAKHGSESSTVQDGDRKLVPRMPSVTACRGHLSVQCLVGGP